MVNATVKLLFLIMGWLSLVLGAIGIFVPVLPTTPFILLAAFCFSKGSQAWHEWLLRQPHLGKLILDWEKHGVIRLRAKVLATVFMIPLFAYTVVFVNIAWAIKAVVCVIGMGALVFVWTRPHQVRG